MFLFLHAGPPLECCLILPIGWVLSIYLITRGGYSLLKTENKARLIIIALILLLLCGVLNQILFITSPIIFPFLEGKGTFVFPFGLFFGLPFLFVFDTRDSFVSESLIFLGIFFNLLAMIYLAVLIENKWFKNNEVDAESKNSSR